MMKLIYLCWWLVCLIASVSLAQAGSILLPGMGGPINVKVESFKEARFRSIYQQEHDFSCGSAALASLLTFHYQYAVTEKQVFDSMFENGDQQRIRRQGFSLLDMKRYLQRAGFDSDGYRLDLDQITERAGVPVIALVNLDGYSHFVIIKGIRSGEVLIGDPSLGIRVMARDDFMQSWNGISFLIKNKLSQGRSSFSLASDWRVYTKAPLATALNQQGLSQFSMGLPQPGEF